MNKLLKRHGYTKRKPEERHLKKGGKTRQTIGKVEARLQHSC